MTSSMGRPSRRRLLPAPSGGRRTSTSTVQGLGRPGIPAAVLALSVTLAGCAGTAAGAHDPSAAASAASGTTQAVPGRASGDSEASTAPASAPAPAQLPGLGPKTLAEIPANARQVVLVTGRGKNSSISRVVLYRRTSAGWEPGAAWRAHNAHDGWTDDHHLNDLRSPIGVFSLTDAGGRLADPGTKLPYTRSRGFTVSGTGFEGEPLAGSFDYVIAINYNRKPGTSPQDWTRPLGANKGGGVWLHVDHGGPTHACVSLPKEHMRELLRTLDPARHPVIVMGDAASLNR